MELAAVSVVVTGGASGLGLATARRLRERGAAVAVVDLPASAGADIAAELGGLFQAADVTDEDSMAAAFGAVAAWAPSPVRAVIHTAGRGRPQRILTRAGEPGSVEAFRDVIDLNVVGSYNALRLGAALIAGAEPQDGERGAIVLTSSVAAFEGQVGQIAYAASKAAIVGMTLCAARDLSSRRVRVCTIAPGVFDTPLLAGVPSPVREALEASVPFPSRLGQAEEYAALAEQVLTNQYLNGETIRLDGAIRMPPS